MSLRYRRNVTSSTHHHSSIPTMTTIQGIGRCLESPGLTEVVVSFFPGAISHQFHDQHKPQRRDNRNLFKWFLLGTTLLTFLLFICTRNGHSLWAFPENGERLERKPKPEVATFTEEWRREEVIISPNSDHTSTPEPEIMGATIAQSDGIMSQMEEELHISFCFDDDTETLLESVDIF